jgi:hypothetical protein
MGSNNTAKIVLSNRNARKAAFNIALEASGYPYVPSTSFHQAIPAESLAVFPAHTPGPTTLRPRGVQCGECDATSLVEGSDYGETSIKRAEVLPADVVIRCAFAGPSTNIRGIARPIRAATIGSI